MKSKLLLCSVLLLLCLPSSQSKKWYHPRNPFRSRSKTASSNSPEAHSPAAASSSSTSQHANVANVQPIIQSNKYDRHNFGLSVASFGLEGLQTAMSSVDFYKNHIAAKEDRPKTTSIANVTRSTNQTASADSKRHIFKLKWNNCCLDGSWRTQQTVYTPFPNEDCNPAHDHLYWSYDQLRLKLTLPVVGEVCLTCLAYDDECDLKMTKCRPKYSGNQFQMVTYKSQIDSRRGRQFFSFQSLLYPKKCITVYSANVTLDECLFSWENCSTYYPVEGNSADPLPLVEYADPELCYRTSRTNDRYLCQQNVFRLEDCIGDAFQSFYLPQL